MNTHIIVSSIFWAFSIGFFILLYYFSKKFSFKLWLQVLIALAVGLLAGYVFGGQYQGCQDLAKCPATQISFIGDGFVRLIRMLIIPLVFATLVGGIVQAKDVKKLGKVGIQAMALYFMTTFLAVTIGLIFASIIKPGEGVNFEQTQESSISYISDTLEQNTLTVGQRLLQIIPDNPIKALANGDILAIIFFAIILGVAILVSGKKGKPLVEFFNSSSDVMLKLTDFVMIIAPFGVYALMSNVIASQGLGVLTYLFKLAIALYLACFTHIILVYAGFVKIGVKLSLRRFFRGIIDAQAVAYSTSSSSATLPVTLNNVTKNLGVHKEVAASVLPIGATINMDGTSIYLGLIALFAAQAFGITPSISDYFLIALTASLVSIGAAGIPSASLFLAMTVLSVFRGPDGMPLISPEQGVLVIAFIFPFDRLLDMMRTVTNVSGDAMVSLVVGKANNMLDEKIYHAKNEKENSLKTNVKTLEKESA